MDNIIMHSGADRRAEVSGLIHIERICVASSSTHRVDRPLTTQTAGCCCCCCCHRRRRRRQLKLSSLPWLYHAAGSSRDRTDCQQGKTFLFCY